MNETGKAQVETCFIIYARSIPLPSSSLNPFDLSSSFHLVWH